MATNAKEYKDLAAAQSLSADDLLAVAQADKQELVTTTVAELSQEVANEVASGPLSELEMAVSIGKTQLAQRLTEKGAASTTQDTLVQMADKLNNLVIDDQLTNVVCKAITALAGVGNPNISYTIQYVNGGDLLSLDNTAGKLYYIRKGAYQGMSAAVAAAVSSVTLPSESSKLRHMSISQNEKYVVIDTGDQQLSVYEINAEAGTITLANAVTTSAAIYRRTSSSGQTAYASFVSNDGDIIGYVDSTELSYHVRRISTETELSVGVSSLMSGIATVDQESSTVYILSNSTVRKVVYDLDESTIEIQDLGAAPAGRLVYIEPRMQKLIATNFDSTDSLPGGQDVWTYDISMSVYDLSTLALEDNAILYRQFVSPARGQYGVPYPFYGIEPMVQNNQDGTFNIIRPTHLDSPVVYDTNQNKFTAKALVYESMCRFTDNWQTENRLVCLGASDTNVWAVSPSYYQMPTFGPCLYISYANQSAYLTYTAEDKYFGYTKKSNDGRYAIFGLIFNAQLSTGIMDTMLATGIMDLETTEVPLP